MSDEYEKEFRLELYQSFDKGSYKFPYLVHQWTIREASDIPDLGDIKELMRERLRRMGQRLPRQSVNAHTRAKKAGTLLLCPKCDSSKDNRVFHFSWAAITCQNCQEVVDKYDWYIEGAS